MRIIKPNENLKYIHDKLMANENVYLRHDFEKFVMKLVPGKISYKSFAKAKGKKEYEIENATNLALETRISGKIITKEDYDGW